jgi:hypothetical protein
MSSSSRFDKWRVGAIDGVQEQTRQLHQLADSCVGEFKQTTAMTADYVSDIMAGTGSLGQLLSGALIVCFRWWQAPLKLLPPLWSATRSLREPPSPPPQLQKAP